MADHLRLPEPRSLDSRRRRGGAQDETRVPPNPLSHGNRLTRELAAALSATPRVVVEGVDPRSVFKIRASSRLRDAQLRPRGLVFLGDTQDWTYFVVPDDTDATKVQADLANYKGESGRPVLAEFFGTIGEIAAYGPEDRRGPGVPEQLAAVEGELIVDIVLWPSKDALEARARLDDVDRVLQQFQGTRLTSDDRPLTTMVRARLSSDGVDAMLQLMVVERVRTPLTPFLEPSDWITATLESLEIPEPIEVAVGVIDDGVQSGHALLAGLVTGEVAIPDSRPWATPGSHGTMVAGLAAYGDFELALRDGSTLPQPARLVVARVLEPHPIFTDRTWFPTDLPEHLASERAIRALSERGVRVINMSIADPDAYSGPHVGLWTETIDQLVRELDIVVVISAGNRQFAADGAMGDGGHVHTGYPTYALDAEARIAEPAVAVNAVTVGSIARSGASALPGGRSNPQDIAVAGAEQLSPFSRTGPGVNGTHQQGAIKPEFVHYGGNVVWTEFGTVNDRDPGTAAVSLAAAEGRLFGVGSGTSFAAPRVSRIAAGILERYPKASANLVRALLGISARIPAEAETQFTDLAERHRAFGYGLPNAESSRDSGGARVVMFHEGTIPVDTATIHPIPFPVEFVTGKADRTITISLAYDPPVRRQRREYIAGHLSLDFYRSVSADEVETFMRKQENETKTDLPKDRRRVAKNLVPGAQLCDGSTLQVRRWHAPAANSLLPDDTDTYYLVIKHYSEDWAKGLADAYEIQRYALAVELEDRTRTEIDLYNLVRQQITQIARLRVT